MKSKRLTQVIISYAHIDEDYKNEIAKKLSVLKRNKSLELWTDREIGYGNEWLPEIQEKFNACDIAILLISSDFLASDFIMEKELPLLMERLKKGKMHLFPVILRPCPWEEVADISKIQGFPRDNIALSTMVTHEQESQLTNFSKIIRDKCEVLNDTLGVKPIETNLITSVSELAKKHFIEMGYEIRGRSSKYQIIDQNIFSVKKNKIYTIIPIFINDSRIEYIKKLEGELFWKYRNMIWSQEYLTYLKNKFNLKDEDISRDDFYKTQVKIVDEWRSPKENRIRAKYPEFKSKVQFFHLKNHT